MTDKLWRRIWNSLGFGQVQVTDDSGPVLRAQVRLNALETRDGTPVVQQFGLASNPPAGTDAVLVFLAGDRSNGVAVATNHQPTRPRGQAPGETTVFNAFGMSIVLAAGGITVNANSQPVTVNGATTVTINAATKVRMVTPRLEVTGDIIDQCDAQPRTVAGFRAIYDTHTHGGVQAGGAHTAIPDQQA